MMEAAQLATEAVKLLVMAAPAAKLMAGKAEEGFASESGKKLLTWLTGKMTAPVSKDILARALNEPETQRYRTALEVEIAGLAKEDRGFREELEGQMRLANVAVGSQTQTATASGSGHKQIQIVGSHNSVG